MFVLAAKMGGKFKICNLVTLKVMTLFMKFNHTISPYPLKYFHALCNTYHTTLVKFLHPFLKFAKQQVSTDLL